MSIQFYKKDAAKQKIFDILNHIDFEHLVIETENTINHIEKFSNSESVANYFWLIKIKSNFSMSSLDAIPHTYFYAESLVNELCAWLENKKEVIKKISALLVVDLFD